VTNARFDRSVPLQDRAFTRTNPVHLSEETGAIILAGGKNSRMGGEDKAFLMVGGQSVFERTLTLLHRCFPQVLVVSNHPDRYRQFSVEVTTDDVPGLGPLGGLQAGLRRVRHPYAFVVACDMPFLRPEPIGFLLRQLSGQDAVIPQWEGDIEPLHALYATHLGGRVAHAMANGTRSIRQLLPSLNVEYVPEGVMRAIPGATEAFRNINTPEDAARYAVVRRAQT
jgi:molybdopterin-guanine dinucleotide biosynthesis protein A